MEFKLNFNCNFLLQSCPLSMVGGSDVKHQSTHQLMKYLPTSYLPLLTDWHRYSISLGVQQSTDLRELAVPFGDVLQRS